MGGRGEEVKKKKERRKKPTHENLEQKDNNFSLFFPLLLLPAPHPAQMIPHASSSKKKLRQAALEGPEKVGCVCA